jgi:hypothetical protein
MLLKMIARGLIGVTGSSLLLDTNALLEYTILLHYYSNKIIVL